MPSYNCELCNFSTKIKTHYIRHVNTPKHNKNIFVAKTSMEGKTQKKPIFDPNLTIFDPNLTIFDPNLQKNNKNKKKNEKTRI